MDNIAHNIANANTAGFKTRRAQFQDLLYQNLIQPGASAEPAVDGPDGTAIGSGYTRGSNEIIFTQGDFSQTKIRWTW